MKKLVLATVGVALVAVLAAALGSAKTSGPTQAKATKLPPLPADIKSRNRFIIGVKCDVPPFGYIDVQGKNQGFDVDKEVYVDMFEAGIIDPTKVSRTALQNAASVASLMLTTEAIVTEIPEKKKAPAGPGGGGYGGEDF